MIKTPFKGSGDRSGNVATSEKSGAFLVVLVDCVCPHCAEPAKQAALKAAQQEFNLIGMAVGQFIETCTEQIYAHVT